MLGHSVARAATRVAARPGATIGRIVCLSTSRGSVEQAVLRLCEQHGTAASSQEALDNLTLKFKARARPLRLPPAPAACAPLLLLAFFCARCNICVPA
eukprot:scaffold11625_cov123-Isochrysis_galbana.AAC.3